MISSRSYRNSHGFHKQMSLIHLNSKVAHCLFHPFYLMLTNNHVITDHVLGTRFQLKYRLQIRFKMYCKLNPLIDCKLDPQIYCKLDHKIDFDPSFDYEIDFDG